MSTLWNRIHFAAFFLIWKTHLKLSLFLKLWPPQTQEKKMYANDSCDQMIYPSSRSTYNFYLLFFLLLHEVSKPNPNFNALSSTSGHCVVTSRVFNTNGYLHSWNTMDCVNAAGLTCCDWASGMNAFFFGWHSNAPFVVVLEVILLHLSIQG